MRILLFIMAGVIGTTAAQGALVNTTIAAKVLLTITLTKTADMDFGDGVQGDAVKVLAPASAGSAAFTVTGTASHTYQIVLPASATLTRTGGAETIAVSAFVHNAGVTPTLGAGGSSNFSVGATRAALGAAQVAGTYAGAFPVTVTY